MQIFLETTRLVLRRLTADDAGRLHELDQDPEVIRYVGRTSPPSYREVARQVLPAWLALYDRYDGLGFFAAIEEGTAAFVGWFHLRPDGGDPAVLEIGYRLRRAAWGQGYATEGVRALVRVAFANYGAARVVATALTANQASMRVLEKAGLRREATFAYMPTGDEAAYYALSRHAYRNGRDEAENRDT